MNTIMKEMIDNFLDDFMNIEYHGKDHIVARTHYREVFKQLLPEYLEPKYDSSGVIKEQIEKFPSENIVIIGAGYGGLTAALRLEKALRKNTCFHIHLVDKNPYHTLKTQLHEAAVRNEEVSIPIDKILRKKKIQFHLGEVTNINIQDRTLEIDNKLLTYNYLIIAIGSKVNYYNIPGMQEYSYPLQSIADAEAIYNRFSKICASSASENDPSIRKENLRFVIGGGGLSGVEFAGELADHTLKCIKNFGLHSDDLEINIVEAANRLIPLMDPEFSAKVEKRLKAKGIKILTGAKIEKRTADKVFLSNNTIINSRNIIWTGGIRISDLIKKGGLKTGPLGRLLVDKYLKVEDSANIYAIGDSALAINPSTGKAVPAAAQLALQQGRLVAKNISNEINGQDLTEYQPKVLGEVVSLGKHLAIGWLALPIIKKITFVGFLGRLLKAAIKGKHIMLLRKESRNWITY